MNKTALTKEELERYSRHLILSEFNITGQEKLKNAKVLVVGAGGLGAPLLQYLAAAGVGTIGIVDFDTVEDSNLQRQVLFTTKDIGKLKVEVAAKRIQSQNPYIQVKTYNTQLTSENALEIIKDYDVIADGTDNFPTRYLVNDACVFLNKVNVYASIFRFEGQLSVFNYVDKNNNRGPNYRDLFPTPPPPNLVPNCAEGGVLGVLAGIMGGLQASEVIKVIAGVGEPLSGRLFVFDTLSFESRTMTIKKNKDNPINGGNPTITALIDYKEFCGLKKTDINMMNEITVEELAEWKKNNVDFQLIDVREEHEYEMENIDGELIPLGTLEHNLHLIATNKKVVIYCRTGRRSATAIEIIKQKTKIQDLYNLTGGMVAYNAMKN